MLAISVSSEVTMAHMMGALTTAVGRLARLPDQGKGDPRDDA